MLALLAAPLLLGGCDTTREALGLTKKAPDEFAVVTKAPLVLPPAFALRPPEPGAARPQDVSAQDRARTALGLGGTPAAAGDRSAAEMALLQQAQATNPDPDIRRKINEEYTQLAERDSSFVDRLIFWQSKEQPALAVDAAKEAQRLRENAATGKPVTEGTVPTIKRRKRRRSKACSDHPGHGGMRVHRLTYALLLGLGLVAGGAAMPWPRFSIRASSLSKTACRWC